jgi:hypothetical protein
VAPLATGFEGQNEAMMSELKKLVILLVAMFAFLVAAYTQTGMSWRGHQPAQTAKR